MDFGHVLMNFSGPVQPVDPSGYEHPVQLFPLASKLIANFQSIPTYCQLLFPTVGLVPALSPATCHSIDANQMPHKRL